jgi:hypothetical protein
MATANWFGPALQGQFGATAARRVDWVTDTIKTALLGSGYTWNQDTHTFWSDVSANEITGTAYVAGGFTLTGKAVNYDATSNTVRFVGSNAVWNSASFTARYGIVWKDTGTATTSPLLGFVDLGGTQTVTAGTFQITWDATDGVLRIVAA